MADRAPYLRLPEPVVVTVTTPDGAYRGTAEGYRGDRVYCRWSAGIGLGYLGWVDAARVQRADGIRTPGTLTG